MSCGLPDASLAVARAYQAAYRSNQNPVIAGLTFRAGGSAADPAALAPGARVTIEVSWLPGSSETFPLFDRATGALVEARETLNASWSVTDGTLERAAADASDPSVLSTTTIWTAPSRPTTAEVVVVLRDSRGGAGVARAALLVN